MRGDGKIVGSPVPGTTLMALAGALRVVLQILVLPVIGRSLGPHAYGQIALVAPLIFFSMMIAESGLGACIVRAGHVTAALEGTVFCFTAGLSLLMIAAFGLIAWPLGHLLQEPLFPPLLLAMSSLLLPASLHIVPAALLLRHQRYDWIACSDVLSSLGGVAGAILGLALGWGVWSLVAQQVVFWVCKTVVVTLGSGYRPRFIFHLSLIRENAHFGANLTGGALLNFIARNIDNLLIGAFIGTEALGYYAMAFQIAGLPQLVLSGSIYFTLFAATSEAKREGQVRPEQFLNVLRGSLLIAVPALVGIAATAPLSVPLLLGDKWLPMIGLVWLLVPLGIAQAAAAATNGVLIGLGRADTIFRLTLAGASLTIVAILIGVQFSASAVAFAVSLAATIGMVLGLWAVLRACEARVWAIIGVFIPPLAASAIMAVAVLELERLLIGTLPVVLLLCLVIAGGVLVYAVTMFIAFRRYFRTVAVIVETLLLARVKRRLVSQTG
jgi:PST family polysaccharide transporter